MINVIFLDIDGVLNHQFASDKNYTDAERFGLAQDLVDNLKYIVDNVDNVKILISSTWRKFHTHQHVYADKYNWRSILEIMLQHKDIIYGDIGTTNEDSMRSSEGRAYDIKSWLDSNKNLGIGSFVILDDECSGLHKHFPNNVVDCEIQTMKGLTIQKAKEAVWILTNFGKDKKMDNVFITSDTHFSHENIIKYCNRPFSTVEEMNEEMIRRWNETVRKDDIVWHLGDFCFGKKENIAKILPRLNGRINLILGNHDHHKKDYYRFPYTKIDEHGQVVTDYSRRGFCDVYDRPILINNFYFLSHAPVQWIRDDLPFANIYGHVHNMEMYNTFTKNTCCVCVERWDYKPVAFKTIIEKFNANN